jgi:hypothetical protein
LSPDVAGWVHASSPDAWDLTRSHTVPYSVYLVLGAAPARVAAPSAFLAPLRVRQYCAVKRSSEAGFDSVDTHNLNALLLTSPLSTVALLNIEPPWGYHLLGKHPRSRCDFQAFLPPNSGPSGTIFSNATVRCITHGLTPAPDFVSEDLMRGMYMLLTCYYRGCSVWLFFCTFNGFEKAAREWRCM